jgi:hypothetical protein
MTTQAKAAPSPKNKKKRWWFLGIVILVIGLMTLTWLYGIERVEQAIYDLNHENSYVRNQKEIDKILRSFKIVSFDQLPLSFKKRTKMDQAKYQAMVRTQKFYVIHKKDMYRRIVGNYRIKDLFSRDLEYHTTYYYDEKTPLYWGIDKRILYKLLLLQDILSNNNYDRDALYISFGHRSPQLNELIGGAALSRHIAGEAVDLTIGDVNKDGKYTDIDKQTVINLCEKFVIQNKGGIGLYPGSRVVHMDVRGYRARWNSY